MKRLSIILLLVFVVLFDAFTPAAQRAKSQAARKAAAGGECIGWSYAGHNGQSHWATLFPQDCAGRDQSPVNIVNSHPRTSPEIEFSYDASRLAVNRVNYGPRINYDPGSSITVGGMTYERDEFHFHLPGEHRISNAGFVMEMHLVHKTQDKAHSAAIAVLFRADGPSNPAFQPIIANLPPPGSDRGGTGPRIEAARLLPADHAYYKYSGSLTTPCCSEPVLWFVLAAPVRISTNQLRSFQNSQGVIRNSRLVQRQIRADQ